MQFADDRRGKKGNLREGLRRGESQYQQGCRSPGDLVMVRVREVKYWSLKTEIRSGIYPGSFLCYKTEIRLKIRHYGREG